MSICTGDAQAIQHLKEAIAEGKHWYVALLEAVKLWVSAEEDYNGMHYQYLIDNEAFDWLVLAQRLCEEVDGLIPEEEQVGLLFFDHPPIELTREEFGNLIGDAKYQAYLNYLYGVLVEKFLVLAVKEEIRKGKRVSGVSSDNGVADEAYQRIYDATQKELLRCFRKERQYAQRKSIDLGELDEFTYWLFKHRINGCDKSRVASDTKKALTQLQRYLSLSLRRERQLSQIMDSNFPGRA